MDCYAMSPVGAMSAMFALLLLVIAGAAGAAAAPPKPASLGALGERMVGWDTYRHLDRLPDPSADTLTRQLSSSIEAAAITTSPPVIRTATAAVWHLVGPAVWSPKISVPARLIRSGSPATAASVTALGNIRIDLDGHTVIDAPLQSLVDGALGAPFVWPLVANAYAIAGGRLHQGADALPEVSCGSASHRILEYYHVDYRRFSTLRRRDHVLTLRPCPQDVLATFRAAGAVDPKPAVPTARHNHRVSQIPVRRDCRSRNRPARAASGAWLGCHDRQINGSPAGLQIEFDGRTMVDSPLGEFFGAGLGTDNVGWLMFATIPQSDGSLSLAAWWPMPFAHTAHVTLVNTSGNPAAGIDSDVVFTPDPQWASALAGGRVGYFTARSHAGPTTVVRAGFSPTKKATENSSASPTPSADLGSKRRLVMTLRISSKEPNGSTRTVRRRRSGTGPAPRTSTRAVGTSTTAPPTATR